jgi:11beta/17beta-hydroxysteroid dehydrogenase
MDFLNFLLNVFVPPASLITLAFSWPALCFLNACEWLFNYNYGEDMDSKVVIITGASSAIGEASCQNVCIKVFLYACILVFSCV